jgi:hypothetical protein
MKYENCSRFQLLNQIYFTMLHVAENNVEVRKNIFEFSIVPFEDFLLHFYFEF